MPTYRRRPAEVEAMRYSIGPKGGCRVDAEPADVEALRAWLSAQEGGDRCRYVDDVLVLPAPQGDYVAERGDWIVQGVGGGLYPIEPAAFSASYEPVAA